MRRLALALMLAGGCGPQALPLPEVLSITPASVLASDSAEVTVKVLAVLPTHADYGEESLEVNTAVTLQVGPVRLGSGRYEKQGALGGVLPSVFEPGAYDVILTLADGRTASLKSGFSVRAGAWPAGYSFDEIPDQRANRPFGVTLRAAGANGSAFHGNVNLQGDRLDVSPALTGAFEAGVRVEMVTLTGGKGGPVTLTASDAEGHSSPSNTFQVKQ